MQRVTRPSAAASLPAPPASPGAPGYFTSGNPVSGQAATVPGYEWFNAVQEELAAVATVLGAPLNAGSTTQVLQAIEGLIAQTAGSGAADTGVANAYAIAVTPAPPAPAPGAAVPAWFGTHWTVGHANTGAATLAVNGLTAPLVRADGSALQPGDLVAGQMVATVANAAGTAWMVLGLAASKVFGAVDTGVANAYVVNPATPLPALAAFREAKFKVANANTGASTLAVSGLGAAPLVRSDGSPLRAGDLLAGQMVSTVCDGVNWLLVATPSLTLSALQAQTGNYVVDTGSANTLTVSPTPPVTALTPGLLLRVQIHATTTGATTIAVSGLPAVPVTFQNGAALGANSLVAGGVYPLVYDGTKFQLQAAPGTGGYAVIAVNCTWTVPAGVTALRALALGGGASAAGSSAGSYTGGGAGGYATTGTLTVTPGQQLVCTIGLGGAAPGVGSGATGNSGGTTSLGSLLSAGGGVGTAGNSSAGGTLGGSTGGNSAGVGASTQTVSLSMFIRNTIGLGAVGSGGGPGGGGLVMPGVANPGGGSGNGSSGTGTSGVGFGAGGGGSGNDGSGGYGAPGVLYIEW